MKKIDSDEARAELEEVRQIIVEHLCAEVSDPVYQCQVGDCTCLVIVAPSAYMDRYEYRAGCAGNEAVHAVFDGYAKIMADGEYSKVQLHNLRLKALAFVQ